jgi:hypothetical protein
MARTSPRTAPTCRLPDVWSSLRRSGIGVGEAYDFEWTPDELGVYVLEVRTSFYPSLGGSSVQRVAFGVGDVDDEALRRHGRAMSPPSN